MKRIRIIPLFLSITLLGLNFGCGENGAADSISSAPSEHDSTTQVETEVDINPNIEAIDCEGKEFTVLSRINGDTFCFPYAEFDADEENGDAINDAVYKRNKYIEEKYNLEIINVVTDSVSGKASSAVLSGDNTYDLILPKHMDAFHMMQSGLLLELSDIPYVDISKPYWMGNIMKDTSIGNHIYFVTGDINISALNSIGVIYFNKDLAAEQGINDLYDTVKNGNWTLDKFSEYCKGVTRDLDGDGLDGDDLYGLTTNGFAWQPFLAGCNSATISRNKTGEFILEWDTEKNIDIITRIINLLNDHESVMLVNQNNELQAKYGGIGEASIAMFRENRALFWIERIYGSMQQRDMDADFGFLPMPKYDSNQENYATDMHMGWSNTCAVPVTNNNAELTGRILEDMAYMSSLTIRPAYYDTTLQGKISRDNESGEMLDIIYSSLKIDPAVIMAGVLPIDGMMRGFIIDNNTSVVSDIASIKSSCIQTLSDLNEKLEEVAAAQSSDE